MVICVHLAKLLRMRPIKTNPELIKETVEQKMKGASLEIFLDQNSKQIMKEINLYKEAKLNLLQKICQDLKYIREQIDINDLQEEVKSKWKFAALVMDRLFCYLSLLYFMITFTSLILTEPNFYKPK